MPTQRQLLLLAEAVLSELPPGWRVRRCKWRWGGGFGGSGLCNSNTRLVSVPWPPTHVEVVAVIAHEVAHAILHDDEHRTHIMEYEAEQWSFRWLRSRGVRIPRHYQDSATRNVRDAIKTDLKKGVKVRRSVRRWAAPLTLH